jgi:hypothetical protein
MEGDETTQPQYNEIDHSLLDWYRELSMIERLRAASKAAAVLERLARAARNR